MDAEQDYLADRYSVEIPAWLRERLSRLPTARLDPDQRMPRRRSG